MIDGMATKLDYTSNPLGTSQICFSFTVHQVDDKENSQSARPKKSLKLNQPDSPQVPMDRMLENQNVESIKKTMQMHEDIFKQQVRELHRLYNVQKMLMDELKKDIKQHRICNSMMTASDISDKNLLSQNHTAAETSSGYKLYVQCMRDDQISREKSGSCSGDTMRMQRSFSFHLERPVEEDISTGISAVDDDQAGPSSITNKVLIGGCNEDSEVELTLSIGGNFSKERSKEHQIHGAAELSCSDMTIKQIRELKSSASFKSDRRDECSDPNTTQNSSNARFDQERKRPNWLFKKLNINRT